MSEFGIYDTKGYNPENIYENRLFSKGCFKDEHYLIKLKAGQFLRLCYCVAQNYKVDQGITTYKNGMFKVGTQIKPVDDMVRVKVCEKAPERIVQKPQFTVYIYNDEKNIFETNNMDSKMSGYFESDDTQYHMIENPPFGSYIELIGLEVC